MPFWLSVGESLAQSKLSLVLYKKIQNAYKKPKWFFIALA
jgi:hypothetical protein